MEAWNNSGNGTGTSSPPGIDCRIVLGPNNYTGCTAYFPWGSTVVLTVTDDGPGIAEAEREAVFDRFTRGSTSVPGGSGLGLSIGKAIVERHGGQISVSSRPGRTVFEMVLPKN